MPNRNPNIVELKRIKENNKLILIKSEVNHLDKSEQTKTKRD